MSKDSQLFFVCVECYQVCENTCEIMADFTEGFLENYRKGRCKKYRAGFDDLEDVRCKCEYCQRWGEYYYGQSKCTRRQKEYCWCPDCRNNGFITDLASDIDVYHCEVEDCYGIVSYLIRESHDIKLLTVIHELSETIKTLNHRLEKLENCHKIRNEIYKCECEMHLE